MEGMNEKELEKEVRKVVTEYYTNNCSDGRKSIYRSIAKGYGELEDTDEGVIEYFVRDVMRAYKEGCTRSIYNEVALTVDSLIDLVN